VEIDKHLHQLAQEELANHHNITILLQDALRNKNNIHPRVLEAVGERLAMIPGSQFKLVANLPYNIATPLISNLLSTELRPVSMTVTIQKELADRIVARPGTKDYSALSIWVQALCDTELVRVLPPSVFWPRPKVHSAILHIAPRPDKRARIPDVEFFHAFVRALFFHRRKFLRSVVCSAYKRELTKPDVDQILDEMSLSRETRAEELEIDAILALCEAIRAQTQG
jgi:16S rRNA (adenine1518-N6/adenine1519-N6)-dimethyltransferase